MVLIHVLSAAEMQACDRFTSERYGVPSLKLMRTAAAAFATFARQLFPRVRRITVLCGRGNNGGDGLMTARMLDAAEPDAVTSPAFALIHEYDGTLNCASVKLFHLDLYRLDSERQLESLGLDDLLTPDAIALVEWGKKFKSIRKKASGEIVIASESGDTRRITVTLKE